MRFEAKKKHLASAISDILSLSTALDLGDGSTLVLKSNGKTLKVSTMYAEAIVDEVVVKEKGTVVADRASLTQALKVSGETFKFSADEGASSGFFTCGRSKGPVSLRSEDVLSALENAPKGHVHVPGLASLLSSISLKSSGQTTDRTLHFSSKDHCVRGEASDGFRGVTTLAVTGEDDEFESVSLSLPQKATDALAKLVNDARVGFDENVFFVSSLGFRCVVPLSSNAPLHISDQIAGWLGDQDFFGEIVVSVGEARSALADVMSMVNSPSARLVVKVDGSSDAKFEGNSDAGEVEADFNVVSTNLRVESITFAVSGAYLKECIDFYKGDNIKIAVYRQALAINMGEPNDHITSHITVVPLLDEIDSAIKPKGDGSKKKPAPEPEPDEEEDEDDEDEAPPPPKKKADKKKKPEPEPEEEDDEDEAEEEDDEDEAPPPPKKKKADKATKKKPEPEPEDEDEEEDDEEAAAADGEASADDPDLDEEDDEEWDDED